MDCIRKDFIFDNPNGEAIAGSSVPATGNMLTLAEIYATGMTVELHDSFRKKEISLSTSKVGLQPEDICIMSSSFCVDGKF